MVNGLRIRFDKRQTTPVRMGWDSDYKKTTKENQDIKSENKVHKDNESGYHSIDPCAPDEITTNLAITSACWWQSVLSFFLVAAAAMGGQ